jgi:hypothetical protein
MQKRFRFASFFLHALGPSEDAEIFPTLPRNPLIFKAYKSNNLFPGLGFLALR